MATYQGRELLGAPAGTQVSLSRPAHGWPFWVGITLLGVLLAAGLAAGAFFVGQGTRPSHAELTHHVAAQASHDRIFFTGQMNAQRSHMLAVMKKRVKQANQKGYANGQSAGYSSGQQQGYSSGQADGKKAGKRRGKREGYIQGFGEGTCYDPVTFAYVC
ncbi:MAG: hypothetical protein ACJ77M_10125 [Thermoleophilaceae bacterium]